MAHMYPYNQFYTRTRVLFREAGNGAEEKYKFASDDIVEQMDALLAKRTSDLNKIDSLLEILPMHGVDISAALKRQIDEAKKENSPEALAEVIDVLKQMGTPDSVELSENLDPVIENAAIERTNRESARAFQKETGTSSDTAQALVDADQERIAFDPTALIKHIEKEEKARVLQKIEEAEEPKRRAKAEQRVHKKRAASPTIRELAMSPQMRITREAAEAQVGRLGQKTTEELLALLQKRYPGFQVDRAGFLTKKPLNPFKRGKAKEAIFRAITDELQRRETVKPQARVSEITSARVNTEVTHVDVPYEEPQTTMVHTQSGRQVPVTSARRKKSSLWQRLWRR